MPSGGSQAVHRASTVIGPDRQRLCIIASESTGSAAVERRAVSCSRFDQRSHSGPQAAKVGYGRCSRPWLCHLLVEERSLDRTGPARRPLPGRSQSRTRSGPRSTSSPGPQACEPPYGPTSFLIGKARESLGSASHGAARAASRYVIYAIRQPPYNHRYRPQAAQANSPPPMARNSTGRTSRELRLFQVGQVPHNCWAIGLSCPSTILFRKP
jgi:hypothetical protein